MPALVAWALYDWANSAFSTIIQTFVFATYFTRQVAADEAVATAQWGNAVGLAGLAIALAGPVLGAVADHTGRAKPWLAAFTAVCIVATALLWTVAPDSGHVASALALLVVATIAFELAGIFYNAMLPRLAPPQAIGRWSGWAWGLGYAGGVASLLVALFAFIGADEPWIALDRGSFRHVRATFVLAAVWYLVFSLPLFLLAHDPPAARRRLSGAVRDGVAQLAGSLRQVRRYAHIVRFLVARMLYADGLATLFAFGGVYAAGTFDMDERQILLFGLTLNVTAGVGAIGFAWIDDLFGPRSTILGSLAALIVMSAMILFVDAPVLFWIAGAILGVFVGPVQAASRSYLARVAPAALRNEMFGLYVFSGKATAFVGPLMVGWVSYLAGSQRIGMATIVFLFLAGLALLLTVPRADSVPR